MMKENPDQYMEFLHLCGVSEDLRNIKSLTVLRKMSDTSDKMPIGLAKFLRKRGICDVVWTARSETFRRSRMENSSG